MKSNVPLKYGFKKRVYTRKWFALDRVHRCFVEGKLEPIDAIGIICGIKAMGLLNAKLMVDSWREKGREAR